MSAGRCVLLYTKPARPGRVKTRLIGALTAKEAAALHEAFVRDLAERLARGSFALEIAWALDPGERPPPCELPALRQPEGDLGERLFAGLSAAAERYAAVAAVGSDHPELPLAAVEAAFEALEGGADVALGPASDGGYYLVASRARALDRRLFEAIPWSTPRVLSTTLERAATAGLRVHLLAVGSDVDTPDDLDRLARSLAAGRLQDCPRTRELLGSWGRA